MPPLIPGGNTCTTRANATGPTPKTKEEQALTSLDTAIIDAETAMEYLIDTDFKSEDDELTFKFLSILAMQISQQVKLLTKQVSEGLRALSYLIFDLHQKRTVMAIMDIIAKAVSMATKRVHNELEVVTEQLAAAAVTSTNTVEELHEECRSVVTELKDAVEETVASLVNVDATRGQGTQDVGGEGRCATSDSYADSIKKHIPVVHARMVAKAKLQKRKIRLVKALGNDGQGLGNLSERQWVDKANVALTLLDVQEENRLEAVNFVGVNKERENRGVIFEMNSGEAAEWLRNRQVMAAFIAKMGEMVNFKEQTYEVVVDWVPVSFEVDSSAAWKRVEQSNGLWESAIQDVSWIKPTHLHSENQ